MPNVTKNFEVSVDQKTFYDVVSDVEKYPEFLSEVVGAKIISGRGSQQLRVSFELDLVKKFNYILDFDLKPSSLVTWKLVESNFFKENSGSWKLSKKGAKSVAVDYCLEVAFGFLVPGFISKKLTEINLPSMFKAFEERAKQIKGKK